MAAIKKIGWNVKPDHVEHRHYGRLREQKS